MCVLYFSFSDDVQVYPAPVSSAGQGPKKAVRGLSLGVRRGECFGLLGKCPRILRCCCLRFVTADRLLEIASASLDSPHPPLFPLLFRRRIQCLPRNKSVPVVLALRDRQSIAVPDPWCVVCRSFSFLKGMRLFSP